MSRGPAPSKIDLDRQRPEMLIDSVEPLALAQAVEALDCWGERHLNVVDDVLTNWAAQYIARPADSDGLANLESSIARVLDSPASRAAGWHGSRPESVSDFAARWRGLLDAVRARQIKVNRRDPERIMALMHVADIKARIETGTHKQSDLARQLDLSPSRLSQVLSLMESNGLIERKSAGREKLLSVPLPLRAARSHRSGTATGQSWRGTDFLLQQAPQKAA